MYEYHLSLLLTECLRQDGEYSINAVGATGLELEGDVEIHIDAEFEFEAGPDPEAQACWTCY
jgi:hypothetical protein